MRHYRCNACQQHWEFEESTTQAHGAALVCPACNSSLREIAKPPEAEEDENERSGGWLGERFLGAPMASDAFATGARFILWCLVIWVSIPFFKLPLKRLDEHHFWLDRVNLVFHEAGHWIFNIFGNELLTWLGGGLGQLLMPLILAGAFFIKNRDCYSAALGLWWAGQSLVDTSIYINDARTLALTLIGGKTGKEVHGHDWNNILTRLDLLDQDIYIARDVLLTGRVIMAIGLAWMLAVMIRSLILRAQKQ